MTFRELFEAAKAVDPSDSISVDVTAWHHRHTGESIEWSIWSVSREAHYRGATADEALSKFEAAARVLAPAALDAVGEVTL
jgi:hypothetical protein